MKWKEREMVWRNELISKRKQWSEKEYYSWRRKRNDGQKERS